MTFTVLVHLKTKHYEYFRPGVRGFGDKGYDLATFGHRHTYADEDEEIDGWLQTKKDKKAKVQVFFFMSYF